MQLLSCHLFSIPVSEDRNRPADPPGDHLVSRPITKFNGQPSLPVLLATEYHRLQRIAVAKIAGYRADGLLTGFIQDGPVSRQTVNVFSVYQMSQMWH